MNEDTRSQGSSIPVGGFKPEQAWVVIGLERGTPKEIGDIQPPVTRGLSGKSISPPLAELDYRWQPARPVN